MKEPGDDHIAVSEIVTGDAEPHPIVARARESFQRPRAGAEGDAHGQRPRVLITGVSAGSRDRALRLFDALFKAAEARGHTVTLPADDRDGACVLVDGQPVRVGLNERYDRFPHVLTKEEQQRLRRGPDPFIPRLDLLPSGELTFIVENVFDARTKWSEGERWRQEERISAVLGGIEVAARNLRDERQERERQEAQRRAAEAARRREEEQRRAAELERQVHAWCLARDIRAFVAELRQASEAAASDGPDDGFAAWLDGALAHADRIDPVVARRRPRPGGGEDDRNAHGR